MDSNAHLTSDMRNDSMMDNTPKASVPVNSERSAVLSDHGAKLLARKWRGLYSTSTSDQAQPSEYRKQETQ